jgi:aryl-alcohol dehydrogenase-like predicted oxidoreductase
MGDMRLRRLGHSGLAVSVVGLGCNNFGRRIGEAEARLVVDAAIDAGITLFDTSDTYADSEVYLGSSLAGRRDDVIIATKFGNSLGGDLGEDFGARGARRYIRRAVERSLRRLRTDWIDLYQLHRPDPLTPIEETLDALTDLIRAGKVRYLGCSKLAGWQIADAEWTARARGLARFISVQDEYNIMDRGVEAEVLPACGHFGIGFLPFYPLANGLLTGKYRRGQVAPARSRLADDPRRRSDDRLAVVERLERFAAERGVTLLDLAVGGLAAKPQVASVIAGATTPEQVRANIAAAAWVPEPDELAAIDELTRRET